MRLKRWESPRRRGRNDKGKGGSARQRQLKKQQQMLRKKLKGEPIHNPKQTRKSQQKSNQTQQEGRDVYSLPSFLNNFFGELRSRLHSQPEPDIAIVQTDPQRLVNCSQEITRLVDRDRSQNKFYQPIIEIVNNYFLLV